jgi:hypothetical protein
MQRVREIEPTRRPFECSDDRCFVFAASIRQRDQRRERRLMNRGTAVCDDIVLLRAHGDYVSVTSRIVAAD